MMMETERTNRNASKGGQILFSSVVFMNEYLWITLDGSADQSASSRPRTGIASTAKSDVIDKYCDFDFGEPFGEYLEGTVLHCAVYYNQVFESRMAPIQT